jgi:hypothetical protein
MCPHNWCYNVDHVNVCADERHLSPKNHAALIGNRTYCHSFTGDEEETHTDCTKQKRLVSGDDLRKKGHPSIGMFQQ